MAEVSDAIFREYDIRGVFGEDLTVEVAELLGRGYAVYLDQLGVKRGPDFKVTIGRDVRLSSGKIRDGLVKGLTGSGINCIDLGECPTPLQYYSMYTLAAGGGFMITGSHNPPEYNGFKVSIGKETIHGEQIQRMKHIIREHVIGKPYPDVEPGKVERKNVIPGYIEYVAANIEMPELDRPIKVVLDSGNGTAGPVAPPLARKLGCEVIELFSKPDGNFPNHHPDPTVAANLHHLIGAVIENEADFGVAYDGDADRIGVVDEKGGIIWGDKLMIAYARSILEAAPGATIVGEVKCSQVMYDEIARWGGNPVMWKTGHSLIKARMKELKAAMAGEMSGHIFFADRWFGFDDAVYASARLIEIVARKLKTDAGFHVSSMFASLPQTVVTPEIRIDCPDDQKFSIIQRLEEAIGSGTEDFKINDIIKIDGLRINFDGGWALVRASNTQPVLVLRFEATDDQLLERAKNFMKTRFEQVRPGEALAF